MNYILIEMIKLKNIVPNKKKFITGVIDKIKLCKMGNEYYKLIIKLIENEKYYHKSLFLENYFYIEERIIWKKFVRIIYMSHRPLKP